MSTIGVTIHSENIRNILYKPPPLPHKAPRYRSIFKDEIKKFKGAKQHATMGLPDGMQAEQSSCFLKRGGGHRFCAVPAHRDCHGRRRPLIPPRIQGAAPKAEEKNHRVENIKKAVRLKPSEPKHRIVDSCDGHTTQLDDQSYLRMVSTQIGRVPNYLVKRTTESRKTQQEYMEQLENKKNLCTYVNDEERKTLLDGLKENWKKMQKAFVLLPLLTDTICKVVKKANMEKQLIQLEKDIQVLEANPYIYVYD